MKKFLVLILITVGFIACNYSSEALRHRIHHLEEKSGETYRPGFGEFMSSIQVHHAKLWFAGQNNNWRLANFETHEIKELLEDIKHFKADRKESQMLSVLDPAIDSVDHAIQLHDAAMFKSGFVALTNGCNSCHQAADNDFTVIKIPDSPPFSNQSFKTEK